MCKYVCQAQVTEVMEKFFSVQEMLENRQACLRKLSCVQVRPIQPVSPRPESPTRLKSPLFSPKQSMLSTPPSSPQKHNH